MYDILKEKCRDRINYFNKYEKVVKTERSKGFASGARLAYSCILDQLYRNEKYINKIRRY